MFRNFLNKYQKIVRPNVNNGKAFRRAALLRLSADLAIGLEESEISQRVVSGLHDTLGYDYLALFLIDETSGDRIVGASIGFDQEPTRLIPGQGLSELPLKDGRLHYTPDVTLEPNYVYGRGGSEVDVPLWIDGKVQGVLVAESRRKAAFNNEDFEVLTAAAQQASLAYEKARLLAQERKRVDELDALRTTMAEITAELELPALLQAIVERAAGLLNATGGELGLFNKAKQDIEIVVSYNLGKDYVGTRQTLGEGAMGRVAETGQPLIIGDYHTWRGALPEYSHIHASLVAPLKVGGRVVGVFTTVSTDPDRKFTPADLHLLNLFGQQASIAIENARLYTQAQKEIAERQRFEEEIVRQKEYFEALFVNNPVAVVTADLEGIIVSWNPSAERLFKYSQAEVIGRNLDDMVAKNPSIRQEAVGYSRKVINKGRVQAIVKRTRKDGSLVDVELLALPVVVGGAKVGFIAIYVDITDLQSARRAAEAANQAKSIFLANMNHELRTPLNAILGFVQLMDGDANLTQIQQENLAIINQSGEHLLSLINDVLEMSKIEAGQVTLREESFDLHLMLAGLEDLFRVRAEEKDLALRFTVDANLPQFVVTDQNRLRQVLLNLLGNAVKFTQAGEVVLHAQKRFSKDIGDTERVYLSFAIEDTGPGIAEEELLAVFEPFVQASEQQQFHEGTGLGLSISRQFIRLLGGEIAVSSKIGQGSIFEFEVQVGLVDSEQVQKVQPPRRRVHLAPGQPRYRLLIAEDHEASRRLLIRLLEPMGFAVQEVSNGQEAIEVWERWRPHLIWMDMRMPVLDGYEATRRIKEFQRSELETRLDKPAAVIIALTASAFEEDRRKILDSGSDDIVRKPFNKEEIFDALAKHLGVQYIYETKPTLDEKDRERSQEMTFSDKDKKAAIVALPAGLISELRTATIIADLERIERAIGQIYDKDPHVATWLAELAHNFEYEKILALMEHTGFE